MYWLTGRRESFRVRMWKFFFFPHWRSLQASPVPGCLASPMESWPNMSRAIYCYCRWASCWRPSRFSSWMTLNQLANRTQIMPVTYAENLAGVVTGPSLPQLLTQCMLSHRWIYPVLFLHETGLSLLLTPSPLLSWGWTLEWPPARFAHARGLTSSAHLSTPSHAPSRHTLALSLCTCVCSNLQPLELGWTSGSPGELKNRDALIYSSDSDLN